MNTVQRTLVEAWGLIRETFIDPTFNHQGILVVKVSLNTSVFLFLIRDNSLFCRLGLKVATNNGGNVSPEDIRCGV